MNLESQGWIYTETEEKLKYFYPPHVYGTYRPQPHYEPEQYPCWFKEVAIIDNPNGPDHAILAYVYPE